MKLTLQKISREFKQKQIFATDELTINNTGIVALTGPNGSGKTTLLRILATVLMPTRGDAFLNDQSILRNPMYARQKMGTVLHSESGFFPHLTGIENLLLFGQLRALRKNEIIQSINSLNHDLDLEEALQTKFAICSSGMKQKLHFCRALLHQPELLLLDEPTRSLDTKTSKEIQNLIQKLSQNKIIILATHNDAEIKLAQRLWTITNGILS